MAKSVHVAKDISKIKPKLVFNLTKRQLICFSAAAVTGIPLYLATKSFLGTQLASLLMVGVMLPFFFVAIYTKDGMPAEKIFYLMIRQKYLLPGIRPYQSENIFKILEERERIRKEVSYLEEKIGRQTSTKS